MCFNYQPLSAVTKEQHLTKLKRFVCFWSTSRIHVAIQTWFIILQDQFLKYVWLPMQWWIIFFWAMVIKSHNEILIYWVHQCYRSIHAKGAPLNNYFGFIDGTVRPISRPGQHQRIVYKGHKRVHLLKFQSVALPNGLIGNMYGPFGKLCSLGCHKK